MLVIVVEHETPAFLPVTYFFAYFDGAVSAGNLYSKMTA
jgi:hypothetical protein